MENKDEKKINGEPIDLSKPAVKKQPGIVKAGAMVHLDDITMEHGMVLIHPGFAPFKLFFNIKEVQNPETNKLDRKLDFHFEGIAGCEDGMILKVGQDAIDGPKIKAPEKPKLII